MNKKERIVYERKRKTREKMRIPSSVRHQYLHFTNAPVKAYVVIAPKL